MTSLTTSGRGRAEMDNIIGRKHISSNWRHDGERKTIQLVSVHTFFKLMPNIRQQKMFDNSDIGLEFGSFNKYLVI